MNCTSDLDSIYEAVGGHAGHVAGFRSRESIADTLSQHALSEMQTLKEIDKGKTFCNYFGCYDGQLFSIIMKQFEKERSESDPDPAIPRTRIMRESSAVSEEVIKYFVSEGYLFYNPIRDTLQSRNKVMLDVFVEKVNSDKNIALWKNKLLMWDVQCPSVTTSTEDCYVEDRRLFLQELRKWEDKKVYWKK
jgi:hypothetical protein